MAKEVYGVEIKAEADGFTKKMNELKQLVSQATSKVKTELTSMANSIKKLPEQATKSFSEMRAEFSTGLTMNTDQAEAEVQRLTTQLQQAEKELNKLSSARLPDSEAIARMNSTINTLQSNLKATKADLDTLNNSNLAQLGAKIQSIGQSIKNAFSFDNIKQKFSNLASNAKSSLNKVKKQADSTSNSFTKMSNKMGNSLKRVVLAFVSVEAGVAGLRKAVESYLAYDTELSTQLDNTWSALGSTLAPVIEFIINLFSKAVAYINAFVKALTGIDSVARANQKALANQNKETNKSLSRMDEITNIDTGKDSNNGAGTGIISLPDVDTSKIEAALAKIKEIASTLFEPIKSAWDTYGASVLNSAKGMLESIWGLIKSIGQSFAEVWLNGTGEEIIGNFLQLFQQIFDIIGGIAEALRNAWENNGNGTAIIQNIADIFKTIQDFVLSIGDSLKQWILSEGFQEALNAVFQIFRDLTGYISSIGQWLLEMYNTYLKPVVDNLLNLISKIITSIGEIWNAWKPGIEQVISVIQTVLEPIIDVVSTALNTVIDIIGGIIDIVTGALTGNWEKAWNGIKNLVTSVWDGILSLFSKGGQIFLGVVEGIGNIFKSIINALITGINKVIRIPFDVINGLLNTIRSIEVLGVAPFKGLWKKNPLPVPQIPKLDVGTNYVPEDQMAYIHKGEAVVPKKFNSAEYFNNINNNDETNALLLDLNRTMNELLEKDTNFYVNGKQLAQATYNDFKNEEQRLGTSSTVRVR